MKRIEYIKVLLFVLCILCFMQGCMDDDLLWQNQPITPPSTTEGVFIINEGNFMYGNASLSYYDPEEMMVYNDVFFNVNGLPLGDVAQSMTIRDNLGYIVVNNSGRIYVIDIETFELKGKITGLTSPRYIHFINEEKAYVTDLYAKAIAIVNPKTYELTDTISVDNQETTFYQHPTDQMVQIGKYIYTNAWSFDNQILIIDTETDQWVDKIEVPIQPQSMVVDKMGKLWVLSDGGFDGNPYGHEPPALVRIDPESRQIETTYWFELQDQAMSLTINSTRDTLYFINRHVYRHPVTSDAFPEMFIESFFPAGTLGGFRALGVDPNTSEVYVGDAIDFVQPGIVYRFRPQGQPIDTLRVGISPGNFAFKVTKP